MSNPDSVLPEKRGPRQKSSKVSRQPADTLSAVSKPKPKNTVNNPATKLTLANQICLEAGLPTLTAQEFERFYSVPAVKHGVNIESPSRALEAEWRPGLLGAMRLAILWHEGAAELAAAELAAGIKSMAAFQEWQDAAPKLANAAATLRSLVH